MDVQAGHASIKRVHVRSPKDYLETVKTVDLSVQKPHAIE
jgi:hypothetical protein